MMPARAGFCVPGDGTLLNVVEIRLAHNALHYLMARTRKWLDHQGSEPKTFRYSFDESDVVPIAQGVAAIRRIEAEPRHVAPHRLALLLGPVGDRPANWQILIR